MGRAGNMRLVAAGKQTARTAVFGTKYPVAQNKTLLFFARALNSHLDVVPWTGADLKTGSPTLNPRATTVRWCGNAVEGCDGNQSRI